MGGAASLAGPIGSAIGGAIGGSGSGANGQSQAALDAGNVSAGYTQSALNVLDQQFQNAAMAQMDFGKQAQGVLSPYNLAGYNALDRYQQTLGLSTPAQGSYNLAQAEQGVASAEYGGYLYNGFQGPSVGTIGGGSGGTGSAAGNGAGGGPNGGGFTNPNLMANPAFGSQTAGGISGVNGNGGIANQFTSGEKPFYGPSMDNTGAFSGTNPAALAAIQASGSNPTNFGGAISNGYFINPQTGQGQVQGTSPALVAQMLSSKTTPTSQVMSDYFNTAGYQTMFGNNATEMNPNASPLARFGASPFAAEIGGYDSNKSAIGNYQQSPGYQFQQQQGQNAVTNNAAASGMLNSTQFANGLLNYSQGLANNDYQQYQTNLTGALSSYLGSLGQNYGSYQSNLASLAGMGQQTATNTGAILQGMGNQLTNNQQQLGTNSASLYQNLGTTQANALNTSASLAAQNQQANSALGASLGGQIGPSLFGNSGGSSGGGGGILSALGGLFGG